MENEKKLPTKKKKSYVGRWIKLVWLGFIGTVAAIVALFFSISQGFLGEMPDMKDIENPDIYVASEIISSDGVVLGKFEKEKTQPVTYNNHPPYLVYALYANEF